MFCELKGKDIKLIESKRIRAGDRIIQYYDCSECFQNRFGKEIRVQCDKMKDDRCLVKIHSK